MNILANRGVLVNLTATKWSATKRDKKATAELAQRESTADGMVRVNKTLLDCAEYKQMEKAYSAIRARHYELTSPYDKGSTAFLPSAHIVKYEQDVSRLIMDYHRERDAFLHVYASAITQAKNALQAMYNADDYPASEEIRAKCTSDFRITPVPDASHFLAQAANEEIEKAKKALDAANEEKVKAITLDAWTRLQESVQTMIDRLGGYDPSKPRNGFHGTLVQNIRDNCEVMRGLNVTDDPEMERVRRLALDTLTQWDAPQLKSDSIKRERTHDAARHVAREIGNAISRAEACSAMFNN